MRRRPAREWPHTGPILAATALAAALRVVSLGRESLWFDEAVSYLAASLPVTSIVDNTVQSSHPPLYYLALHFWLALVPNGDGFARLLGLIWNVLLILVVYALAQVLFRERRISRFAALATALSPFHILFSHELRMYTQLMLFVALGALAYIRASRAGSRRWWALFVLSFGAAVFTHLFAWLAYAAIAVHALVRRRQQRTLVAIVTLGLVLTVAFVPWLMLMAGETQKDLGSLRPLAQATSHNPIKPITSPTFLLFGMSTQPVMTGIHLFLTLSMAIVIPLEVRKARRQQEAGGLSVPSLMLLFTLGVPVLIFMVRPFFLPERTMAAASPFLILFLAWGLARRASPLPALAWVSLVVMAASSVLYLAGEPIKPPYRDAMELVLARWRSGDVILHTSDGSYLPALRYADLSDHALLAGDPDPRKPETVYWALGGQVWDLQRATDSGDRLWLVVALEHSVDWQQAQAALVAATFPLLERFDVGGIDVLLYDLEVENLAVKPPDPLAGRSG